MESPQYDESHRAGRPLGDATKLLRAFSSGEKAVLDKLFSLLYEPLRKHAKYVERPGVSLTKTALLNEVYIEFITKLTPAGLVRTAHSKLSKQLHNCDGQSSGIVKEAFTRLAKTVDGLSYEEAAVILREADVTLALGLGGDEGEARLAREAFSTVEERLKEPPRLKAQDHEHLLTPAGLVREAYSNLFKQLDDYGNRNSAIVNEAFRELADTVEELSYEGAAVMLRGAKVKLVDRLAGDEGGGRHKALAERALSNLEEKLRAPPLLMARDRDHFCNLALRMMTLRRIDHWRHKTPRISDVQDTTGDDGHAPNQPTGDNSPTKPAPSAAASDGGAHYQPRGDRSRHRAKARRRPIPGIDVYEMDPAGSDDPADLAVVSDVIEMLRAKDPKAAEVFCLKFFSETSDETVAEEVGGLSDRQVRRLYSRACDFLATKLNWSGVARSEAQ